MQSVVLFADGGSRQNPGPAACGYVVYTFNQNFNSVEEALKIAHQSQVVYSGGHYAGETTNNVAEWLGVLKGIDWVIAHVNPVDELFIFLDSQLVVKQILGEYKVKQPHLKPFAKEVAKKLQYFDNWHVSHIYRKDNSLADKEVNLVLDNVVT
jgi:ribonuclease HI